MYYCARPTIILGKKQNNTLQYWKKPLVRAEELHGNIQCLEHKIQVLKSASALQCSSKGCRLKKKSEHYKKQILQGQGKTIITK